MSFFPSNLGQLFSGFQSTQRPQRPLNSFFGPGGFQPGTSRPQVRPPFQPTGPFSLNPEDPNRPQRPDFSQLTPENIEQFRQQQRLPPLNLPQEEGATSPPGSEGANTNETHRQYLESLRNDPVAAANAERYRFNRLSPEQQAQSQRFDLQQRQQELIRAGTYFRNPFTGKLVKSDPGAGARGLAKFKAGQARAKEQSAKRKAEFDAMTPEEKRTFRLRQRQEERRRRERQGTLEQRRAAYRVSLGQRGGGFN